MNQNFLFSFIFLATFAMAMVNAIPPLNTSLLDTTTHFSKKVPTEFIRCAIKSSPLKVKTHHHINITNFIVHGKLKHHNVTAGLTILGIAFTDALGKPLTKKPFVQKFTKSYQADEAFDVVAKVSDIHNTVYFIDVVVGDKTHKKTFDLYGCAIGFVGYKFNNILSIF